MPYKDKEKQEKYWNGWFHKLKIEDPEKYQKILDKIYLNRKNKLKKYKEMLVKDFGGKCQKCGYDKLITALEFAHINKDDKEFAISGGTGSSYEKLKRESEKCILLCNRCHREFDNGMWGVRDLNS